ncbi:MAG TPA: hypothetical protein VGO98_01830 [Candidatus Saccharimonadales bacterium]|nr:hypothetical protein [Candidatus Saccharimonadales bacterium]
MHQKKLTVEIFRDADRSNLSLDVAEPGIDEVRRIIAGIEIVRATRLLRITRPDQHMIKSDRMRWPKLDADFNIILTDRPLVTGSGIREYGHAETHRGSTNLGIAIIDTATPDYPVSIVAHEFGHLFDVKKTGETWDGRHHCRDEDCFMQIYPSETKIVPERVRQSGVKNFMERYGYRKAQYVDIKTSNANRFCEECAEQIDKEAFFLRSTKER